MFSVEIGWEEFYKIISSLVVLQGFELLLIGIIVCIYVYNFVHGE